jgi:hypothetical protein
MRWLHRRARREARRSLTCELATACLSQCEGSLGKPEWDVPLQ